MPKTLPLPPDPRPLPTKTTVAVAATEITGPVIFTFRVQGLTDAHRKFTVTAQAPVNLGLYGPNPTSLGPPFGRGRAPAGKGADATWAQGEWNLNVGTYYVVVRTGEDGPPGPFTVAMESSWGRVFMKTPQPE
jgi:hypothetical protein